MEQSLRDKDQFQEWLADDRINSFDCLCSDLDSKLKDYTNSGWNIIRQNDRLRICDFDLSGRPRYNIAMKIFQDMKVEVYKGELLVTGQSLFWLLGSECKLDFWSQLKSLLSHFFACAKMATLSILCLYLVSRCSMLLH